MKDRARFFCGSLFYFAFRENLETVKGLQKLDVNAFA